MMEKLNSPKKVLFDIAIIFHDIGKVSTKTEKDGKISFKGHEIESEKIANEGLKKLKFSTNDKNYILKLIKYHMKIHYITDLPEKTQRKEIAKLYIELHEDSELLKDIIDFSKLDDNLKTKEYDFLKTIVESFEKMPQLINGEDVISLPENKRGSTIKKLRYLQLCKNWKKEELKKYINM